MDDDGFDNGVRAAAQAIATAAREEREALQRLIDDEDSSCPAREIRRERARALDYMENLAYSLIDWDWGRG